MSDDNITSYLIKETLGIPMEVFAKGFIVLTNLYLAFMFLTIFYGIPLIASIFLIWSYDVLKYITNVESSRFLCEMNFFTKEIFHKITMPIYNWVFMLYVLELYWYLICHFVIGK